MKKNDALKKHHFWILFGLVPLFVLIAVLVVTSSVGAEINKRDAETDAALKSLSGKTPKSEALVGLLNTSIEAVKKKKMSLWEKNWELQKPLYTWPNSPQLQAIGKMDLKFGDPIPEGDNFAFAEFKKPEVYLAEYSNEDPATRRPATRGMVTSVAPTEFRGGWQNVLRHVSRTGWGPGSPTSNQIWVIMEDIWVQRSLLDAVRSVNAQMAEFHRAKYVREGVTIDDPGPKSTAKNSLRRRFESHTWAVELEVKNKDGKQALGGRLINLTNRLQLMGLNNTMVLNVWFDRAKTPFEFRIGGEFLPGAGAMKPDGTTPANVLEIVPTDDHTIPATFGSVGEIVRVEQKFDTRTVPVRRIEYVVLGKTDGRHAGSQLVPPTFLKPKEDDKGSTGTGTGTGTGGFDTGSASGPPGGTFGTGAMGGTSGSTTPSATAYGGGTLDSAIDGNKNRYITVTPQVRRMPVAVVVLVDQSLIQDVLLSFANTPLRFQVTQVTWRRFRDGLNSGGVGGMGSSGEPGIVDAGPGNLSPELAGGGKFGGRFGGSMFGPPGGMGMTMPSSPSPLGMGGQPNPYGQSSYNPYSASGGLTTVSESQLTSGLVELGIYGVVSLYEKYSPEQEAADAAKEAKDKEAKDKEKDAKDKDGKEKDATSPSDADPAKKGTEPMPKEPMVPEAKGSKMRRRVRARA